MRLEIQELEIVCSLVPSVWLVVETGAWKAACLPLETLLDTEVEVVAEVATLLIGKANE